jgi:glycosyltransferase involved in cell wall biosynthesis
MTPAVKMLFSAIARVCSDGFIVAGQRVYDYYLKDTKLARKPWCEIHAPVETEKYDPAVVEPARQLLSVPGAKIVTVANINPRKGLEQYIEAAALLSSRHKNLSFVIVGPVFKSQEGYHQRLKDLIVKQGLANVTFAGQMEDVRPYLKAADVCLFTSENEASPISIWEAMSMGKAIVSTDVGSVSQHLHDGVSGYIVPAGDVALMVQRVETLLNDTALRSQFGKNARASAVHGLGIDLCAMKHAEFYRKILAQTASAR